MLDWGLGHATRSLPLIRQLASRNKVILGVTKLNEQFFEKHCPQLERIFLPSYAVSYSRTMPAWLKIMMQWPNLQAVMRDEQALLLDIILDHKINVLISDGRYGFFSKQIPSIFITHQLQIKAPVFASVVNHYNASLINRFSEVWVPDYEPAERRLSGELSTATGINIPVKFIGPQSSLDPSVFPARQQIDILVLLSGVEPQRSILEQLLTEKLDRPGLKVVMVRGSRSVAADVAEIQSIDQVYGDHLAALVKRASMVVCRSGYSTLMDLHVLGKQNIVLIPTPGQTEQEYLARYWEEKFNARVITQNELRAGSKEITD